MGEVLAVGDQPLMQMAGEQGDALWRQWWRCLAGQCLG